MTEIPETSESKISTSRLETAAMDVLYAQGSIHLIVSNSTQEDYLLQTGLLQLIFQQVKQKRQQSYGEGYTGKGNIEFIVYDFLQNNGPDIDTMIRQQFQLAFQNPKRNRTDFGVKYPGKILVFKHIESAANTDWDSLNFVAHLVPTIFMRDKSIVSDNININLKRILTDHTNPHLAFDK